MTRIYCFSGSGRSRRVADAFAGLISCEITDIDSETRHYPREDPAVIIFPVYCQNIPAPVKSFLRRFQGSHAVLIATYGNISHGNVLREAQELIHADVIAGAYIPMGHSFLTREEPFDPASLLPIVERIRNKRSIRIPKSRKNPLANVFPALRSRMGVRIRRSRDCNGCGLCREQCPRKAIKGTRITSRCIRCMRCVSRCPKGALSSKNSRIMDVYLNHYYRECSPEIYL